MVRAAWGRVGALAPALAAGFVAAELGLGLAVGRFFDWGRAEALIFHAFRPWLLLVLALIVAGSGWRTRTACYGFAIVGAGTAESLLLIGVGADAPWGEALRGLGAGAALAVLFDLVLQLARGFGGRWGFSAAAALFALLLVLPGARTPYDRSVLGPTGLRVVAERPALMAMTGLPIVWGEGGAFDSASRPAHAYRALQAEFDVRPLDYLSDETLSGGRLMLLAQPRALEPVELAALDRWVRRGGRILVLADPHLAWPSRLPLGDIRRPPRASLLAPLLGHWGLALERGGEGVSVRRIGSRRLITVAEGRWRSEGDDCSLAQDGLVAHCRIGAGAATLVADADLLRDRLWALEAPNGTGRHLRLADNPLLVADWLDALAGVERPRAARPVAWADPNAPRARALALAALPVLLLAALAGFAARRARG